MKSHKHIKSEHQRNTQDILKEIEALHSDAIDQMPTMSAKSSKPKSSPSRITAQHKTKAPIDVVPLEHILWSSDASEKLKQHQKEAVSSEREGTARIPENDDEFDQLLFKLMKDISPPEQSGHRQKQASQPIFDFSAEAVSAEPTSQTAYGQTDVKERKFTSKLPSQSQASPPPSEPEVSAVVFSDELRLQVSQLVYGMIEDRLKVWVDRNLEQIMQDALRYSQTDSTDSV